MIKYTVLIVLSCLLLIVLGRLAGFESVFLRAPDVNLSLALNFTLQHGTKIKALFRPTNYSKPLSNIGTRVSNVSVHVVVDEDTWLPIMFHAGTNNCERSRCILSKQSHPTPGSYDIFLSTLPPGRTFPVRSSSTVKNVVMTMESSVNYPGIVDPQTYTRLGIDLVISFRPPVTTKPFLALSYVNSTIDDLLHRNGSGNVLVPHAMRLPSMLVMVSNCDERFVKRMTIINGMSEFFDTLKYGGCFPHVKTVTPAKIVECLSLPNGVHGKVCALRHVMFVFALENSYENAYVTEKLWVALETGTIPVYSVGQFPENRQLLPHPDAALVLEDFASLHHLTNYMHKIAKDPALWYKHAIAWRSLPIGSISKKFLSAVDNSFLTLPCRLCEWWVSQHSSMRRTK